MQVDALHRRHATPHPIGLFVYCGVVSAFLAHWTGAAEDQKLPALDHRFIEEEFSVDSSASSAGHPVNRALDLFDPFATAAGAGLSGAIDDALDPTPWADCHLWFPVHGCPSSVP
jgi:hypothetical protein